MRHQTTHRRRKIFLASLFMAFAAVLTSSTALYFHHEERIFLEHAQEAARTVADLTAAKITKWRNERLAYAISLVSNPFVRAAAEATISGRADAAVRDQFLQWMAQRQQLGYRNAFLVDIGGKEVLASGPDAVFGEADREEALAAMRQNQTSFSDFKQGPGGRTLLDIIAPMKSSRGTSTGAIILRIDPAEELFPLFDRWPVPTTSGKIALVRDGDPALGAVGKHPGITAVSRISESPWSIIARMDEEEIMQQLRRNGRISIAVLLLLLAMSGITVIAIWRRERLAHEIEHRRAEQALQLNESRLQTLLALSQMATANLAEIASFTLEEAVRLTESSVGYVANVSPDESSFTVQAWSKSVSQTCAIQEKPLIFQVASLGIVGDPIRQHRPVIVNDYTAEFPGKKELPTGHVQITRYLSIPIIEDGKAVIVAGVGNKASDYDESDVRQLTLLMEGIWHIMRRQEIEAQLRQYSEKLEGMVEERTQERDRARASLFAAAKMAAMGRMGAGIAHQLNSPLGGAMLLLDALADSNRDQASDLETLGKLRRSLISMKQIIDSMLTLAMVPLRKPAAETNICLNRTLEQILDLVQNECAHHNVLLRLDFASALPPIQGQPGEPDQIFLNLINNALDAMPKGGTLTIQTLPVEDDVEVRIGDTGSGIAPEHLEKIFEPFFTTRRSRRGVGLGLSIAHEMVQRYRGTIRVESEIGRGTTFIVKLPRFPLAEEASLG